MERALAQAEAAAASGEVPVGAVVTDAAGAVLAEAGNTVEAAHDASAHAELNALRAAAARLGSPRLVGCTLWVTLEPCAMCAAACVHFRVTRVVFGAYDPKGGGVEHGARVFAAPGCLHVPEVVGGVRAAESAALLQGFFKEKRSSSFLKKRTKKLLSIESATARQKFFASFFQERRPSFLTKHKRETPP